MSFNHSIADLVEESKSELLAIAPWWKRVELGAVATILNGYPWQSFHFNSANGEPLIRIRDVTTGRSETRYSGPIEEGYWIHDGDLVVGMDGDFNSRIWEGGRALLNQRVCQIMPDENFYSRRFLAYVLPGYLKEINEATHSITVKHLSSKTLEETPVPLPPLSEQRRIVAKLDELLSRTARARKELDRIPVLVARYRQAVLSAAASGLLTADWRDASPEFRWQPTSIAAMANLVFDGPFGSNLKSRDYVASGVRVVRLENIGHLRFIAEKKTYVSFEKYESLRRHTLNPGDVLFSSFVDEEVRVCMLPAGIETLAINKADCFCIRTNTSRCDSKFLLYRLACPSTYGALKALVHGATRPRITLSQLKAFSFELPPLQEQQEIVRRIEAVFAWLNKLSGEHARVAALLPKLEQALLAKAFRGELVPEDLNDEPASVLLERIRTARAAAAERKSKSRSSKLPRAPRRRAAMTKSRLDQDVMHQPYLAKQLRDAGGSARVEDLFRSADLPVTDFYKQLAWEVEAGHVSDQGALLEAV